MEIPDAAMGERAECVTLNEGRMGVAQVFGQQSAIPEVAGELAEWHEMADAIGQEKGVRGLSQ